MRLILDENLPLPLKYIFFEHEVFTVQELGLSGTKNGALISIIEGHFDVFITADKNLRYQQDLTDRTIIIMELPTNRWPILKALGYKIAALINNMPENRYIVVNAE